MFYHHTYFLSTGSFAEVDDRDLYYSKAVTRVWTCWCCSAGSVKHRRMRLGSARSWVAVPTVFTRQQVTDSQHSAPQKRFVLRFYLKCDTINYCDIMNNDQPEHLNGLCRSALHYLCLIKAFVTKFNFERVEEVHGIVSIDSRLLHYLYSGCLNIYL